MSKTRTLPHAPVDYVVGGGGNKILPMAAALYTLAAEVPAARVIGTSAGGASSLALGFGVPWVVLEKELAFLLQDRRILDGNFFRFIPALGYSAGDVLRSVATRLLGDQTLGDAKIPCGVIVSDLYAPEDGAKLLSSWTTPKVLAADALVTTVAIPLAFSPQTVRGLDLGNRTFCDGGCTKNFPLDELDDVPTRPTVGIRVKPAKGDPAKNPVRSWRALGRALFEMWMWNTNNAHNTAKSSSLLVDIPSDGDGLDFDLEPAEISRLIEEGRTAGRRAIPQALAL